MNLETARRIQKYYDWFRMTLAIIFALLLAWATATVK